MTDELAGKLNLEIIFKISSSNLGKQYNAIYSDFESLTRKGLTLIRVNLIKRSSPRKIFFILRSTALRP